VIVGEDMQEGNLAARHDLREMGEQHLPVTAAAVRWCTQTAVISVAGRF
jgi:hypothetical protein